MSKFVGASPLLHKNQQTISYDITPNQSNGQNMVIAPLSFYLPQGIAANNLGKPTQLIICRLSRDGGADANGNDFVLSHLELFYYSWRTTQIFVP